MIERTWVTGAVVAAMLAVSQGHVAGGDRTPKGVWLKPLGAFKSGLFDEGAVEIAAFDAATARVFVTYAERPYVGVIDISDPDNPVPASPLAEISLAQWGADARSTSVAVRSGIVAVAIPQGEDDRIARQFLALGQEPHAADPVDHRQDDQPEQLRAGVQRPDLVAPNIQRQHEHREVAARRAERLD